MFLLWSRLAISENILHGSSLRKKFWEFIRPSTRAAFKMYGFVTTWKNANFLLHDSLVRLWTKHFKCPAKFALSISFIKCLREEKWLVILHWKLKRLQNSFNVHTALPWVATVNQIIEIFFPRWLLKAKYVPQSTSFGSSGLCYSISFLPPFLSPL